MCINAEASRGSGVPRNPGNLLALGVAILMGACAQTGDMGSSPARFDVTSSSVAAVPEAELLKATEYWGKEHSKNSRDEKAALNYARNLKALGRKQEALAILQGSYLHNSDSRELLSDYGRLALDMGQVGTAAQLLERADDPAKPDWRVISARGTALAKQGQYKDAIDYFERARALAPAQASVINNLAMAYAMDGHAAKAEGLLRQAAELPSTDPRVRQNLALVIELQGKPGEQTASAGSTIGDATTPIAATTTTDADGSWRTSTTAMTTADTSRAKPVAANWAADSRPDLRMTRR